MFFVFACICLAGCQEEPRRFPVSGTVLIDGKPLAGGSIRFVAEAGRPATSGIMSDGSFELGESSISIQPGSALGIMPGVYRVAVSASEIIDELTEEVRWLAPSKYADFRTSGLEVTVDGPQKELIINLTWEGSETTEDGSAKKDSPDGSTKKESLDGSAKKDSTAADVPVEAKSLKGVNAEAPLTQ
jgi:hypothetical protein